MHTVLDTQEFNTLKASWFKDGDTFAVSRKDSDNIYKTVIVKDEKFVVAIDWVDEKRDWRNAKEKRDFIATIKTKAQVCDFFINYKEDFENRIPYREWECYSDKEREWFPNTKEQAFESHEEGTDYETIPSIRINIGREDDISKVAREIKFRINRIFKLCPKLKDEDLELSIFDNDLSAHGCKNILLSSNGKYSLDLPYDDPWEFPSLNALLKEMQARHYYGEPDNTVSHWDTW